MRKIFLLIIAMVSIAASAQITETPEGTLHENLYRYSDSWVATWTSAKEGAYDGVVTKMVEGTDGALYLYNPIASLDSKSWLKLEKKSEGKYVAKLPQLIYSYEDDDDDEGGQSVKHEFFAQRMFKSGTSYKVLSKTSQVEFTWDGLSLKMVNDAGNNNIILGMVNSKGEWQNKGDWSISVMKLTTGEIVPPTDGVQSKFQVNYTGSTGAVIVDAIEKDGKVYLKGLSTAPKLKDKWVEMLTTADGLSFTSGQYLGQAKHEDFGGYSSDKNTYHVFAVAYEKKSSGDSAIVNNVTLKKDAVTGKYSTDKSICITLGTQNPPSDNIKQSMPRFTLTPYSEAAGTPVAPELYYCSASPSYDYSTTNTTLAFYVKNESTEGKYLDPDKMYYNVFVNDSPTPYTFLKKTYNYNAADMTDIPFAYKDSYNRDIKVINNERYLHFYENNINKLGVQMVYSDGTNTYRSSVMRAEVVNTGIENVQENTTAVKEIYSTDGRRISALQPGLNIVRRSDGKIIKVISNR